MRVSSVLFLSAVVLPVFFPMRSDAQEIDFFSFLKVAPKVATASEAAAFTEGAVIKMNALSGIKSQSQYADLLRWLDSTFREQGESMKNTHSGDADHKGEVSPFFAILKRNHALSAADKPVDQIESSAADVIRAYAGLKAGYRQILSYGVQQGYITPAVANTRVHDFELHFWSVQVERAKVLNRGLGRSSWYDLLAPEGRDDDFQLQWHRDLVELAKPGGRAGGASLSAPIIGVGAAGLALAAVSPAPIKPALGATPGHAIPAVGKNPAASSILGAMQ